MTAYDIVTAATAHDLVKLVNQRIQEGWQPQGGVSITLVDYEHVTYRIEKYAQALVREQKPDRPK